MAAVRRRSFRARSWSWRCSPIRPLLEVQGESVIALTGPNSGLDVSANVPVTFAALLADPTILKLHPVEPDQRIAAHRSDRVPHSLQLATLNAAPNVTEQ
jgi:hypothetical protein